MKLLSLVLMYALQCKITKIVSARDIPGYLHYFQAQKKGVLRSPEFVFSLLLPSVAMQMAIEEKEFFKLNDELSFYIV